MTTAPEIYNIPAGKPFVDALAAGILDRLKAGGADLEADPLALADVTVLLPTRRACRSLREAFLRLGGARAMALPRMLPLGDLDEDELVIADAAEFGPGDGDGGDMALPMAIAALRRQLLLSQLVLKYGVESWAEPPGPDQAARLAAELARLVDQVHTERIGFDRLADLVPEDYAEHWQETLEFLQIVTDHWPDILRPEGAVDAAARRNLVIEAQAEAWRKRPPTTPVIAAGSTGTIPATADLLKVVASLPAGAVVLPGLDQAQDAESLEPSHPQFALARLLGHLGVARDAVRDWPAPGVGETAPARQLLIRHALAPAAPAAPAETATDPVPLAEALEGVVRLDCSGPQEEAAAIALMMRETLEHPDKTAALVTPDRGLARRVAAELRRWDIEIDDSAGVPLAITPPGAFLRLVAQMMVDQVAPLALLCVLKHPVACGGEAPGVFRAFARRLELLALRGPRPAPGFQGLMAALRAAKDHAGKSEDGLDGIIAWLDPIARAAEPFAQALAQKDIPLREVVSCHVAFAETLASGTADGERARGLWSGDDGETLAGFISELHAAAEGFPPIHGARYPALLDALLAGRVARPRHGGHPRLNIWGLLEARLQHADLMILGGLNEATWPPDPDPDPWMSRPMRRDFGLPALERRIGLAAHDFTQAFSAPEVAMTRATRVEGTPTVPSRWLLRLDNVMGGSAAENLLGEGRKRWLTLQQALDRPGAYDTPVRPSPCPPVAVRPRRLSVTEIETWMRDPYAIYARHVLKLEPLDAIDADPGAADRGSFIHHALDRFQREWRGDLDDAAYLRLVEIGREAFAGALDRPGIWAFWWPRFERTARWFIDHERARRAHARPLASECRGELKIIGPAGDFLLVAKADRIDRLVATGAGSKEGGLAIIDYKTGAIPSKADVETGFAPQLLLEAVMARQGGFAGVPAAEVTQLGYWRLSGGDPAGEDKPIRGDIATLTDDALAGFERLVARFDDPKTPYLARPRPDKAPRYGDYDHLARVKEWSSGLDHGGGGS